MNKYFIQETLKNNNKNKSILDKSIGFDYSSNSWNDELQNWYTLYLGLYLIDSFRVSKTLAIDVGAYKGFYSSVYCRHFKEVYAFEPNPYSHSICALNFKRQGLKNIKLKNVGLWKSKDKLMFNCSHDNMLPLGVSSFIHEFESIEKTTVDVITLDSLNLSPSFIKIDAEGSEEFILEGSLETIKNHKPFLQIENTYEDKQQNRDLFLNSLGYEKINVSKFKHIIGNINLSDSYYLNNSYFD